MYQRVAGDHLSRFSLAAAFLNGGEGSIKQHAATYTLHYTTFVKLPNQSHSLLYTPSWLGFHCNTRYMRDFPCGFRKFFNPSMNAEHHEAEFRSLWYRLGSLLTRDGEL